jgi:periplasmic divalent cation tolerance protein
MTAHAPDPSHLVVLTTLPDPEAAHRFVRTLVEARVVACGTILGDARSVYRWQGAIEEAAEVQVILKTRRERWDALVEAVREAHPYDVPELLALPVDAGLPDYLRWVDDETGTEPRDGR